MSLINRVLQDLDRRQALGAGDAGVVRSPAPKPARSEWFWRILVVLLAAALAWMGWVAVQLMPRKPLATDLAFLAASEARARTAVPSAPAVAAAPIAAPAAPPAPEKPPAAEPAPAAPAPAPAAAPTPELAASLAAPPAPAAKPAAPPADTLRMATELQTPVPERAPAVEQPPAAAPAKPKAAQAPKSSVDKRDRTRSSGETAEAHFRRAALFLSHGRVSEAEGQLAQALKVDPRHSAARQAYVSLLLDQQRVATARRLLQEALETDPAQPSFAMALARIYASERQYTSALAVLDAAGAVGDGADFQALRGAMLQRVGRHDEAVSAYQNAVRSGNAPATAWIGFAISLEAVGRRAEAAQAYRRALSAGPLAMEAREYAEGRARALE